MTCRNYSESYVGKVGPQKSKTYFFVHHDSLLYYQQFFTFITLPHKLHKSYNNVTLTLLIDRQILRSNDGRNEEQTTHVNTLRDATTLTETDTRVAPLSNQLVPTQTTPNNTFLSTSMPALLKTLIVWRKSIYTL